MTFLRLTHTGICVADLPRACAFYRALGFEELGRLEAGGEAASRLLGLPGSQLEAVYLERDGLRIELLHYAAPGSTGDGRPRAMNALGLTHLSFRVADLAKATEEVQAAGGAVLDASRIEMPAAHTAAVFVTDPDGTRIELVEAPGDPLALPRGT